MRLIFIFFSIAASLSALFLSPQARAESLVAAIIPVLEPGFAQTPEAQGFTEVCPHLRLEDARHLKLIAMEKRLLCGDHNSDVVGRPWLNIPPNQAAYFLKGFLQTRGYHHPVFIQDGETLFARPGTISYLRAFSVVGGPATWEPPRRRLVVGQAMTPALLDDLHDWTLGEIKNEGYACATVSVRADPDTGEAEVALAPGDLDLIRDFHDSGDEGLAAGVLDRYDAFRIGDLYRQYLIDLTRKRTQDDGILQTYVITTRCRPDGGVTIVRDLVLGPSRTIQIAAGASSDQGGIVQAVVRENRIGATASSAQAQLRASYLDNMINQQRADAKYTWYYRDVFPRSYIEPAIDYLHDAEAAYENRSSTAHVFHGWTHEFSGGQVELRAGPAFLDSHLIRGQGPSDVTVNYLESDFRWTAHSWEFFQSSPRSGENLQGSIFIAEKGAGSTFTAQRLQLQGEKLWSILPYDPPLLILGVRFNTSSVFSPDGDITPVLPVNFLTFLGGDQDLRGFDPDSLPRSGVGALSAATASFEARLHKVIFRRADVFAFLDSGLLGQESFALSHPYLMSPGMGLRWESLIGVLRLYIAERFALAEQAGDEPYGENDRVGFTFGQEF